MGKRELRNTRKARKGKPSTFAVFAHFVVKSGFRWLSSNYFNTLRRLMKLLRSKPRVLKKDNISVESQRTAV